MSLESKAEAMGCSLGTVCACRRGSSVALMLDVRSLGTVEPICSVNTPREVTLHFLRTAGHPLTRWTLQHQPPSPKQLEEEFLVRIWGPLHITLRFHIRPSWIPPGASLLHGVFGEELRGAGERVVPVPALPLCVQRVEREIRRLGLTHLSSTIRRSPQTSSTLKTWISLAMPPKTDTRPSCQVRSTVGLRGIPGGEELKKARYIHLGSQA